MPCLHSGYGSLLKVVLSHIYDYKAHYWIMTIATCFANCLQATPDIDLGVPSVNYCASLLDVMFRNTYS